MGVKVGVKWVLKWTKQLCTTFLRDIAASRQSKQACFVLDFRNVVVKGIVHFNSPFNSSLSFNHYQI